MNFKEMYLQHELVDLILKELDTILLFLKKWFNRYNLFLESA